MPWDRRAPRGRRLHEKELKVATANHWLKPDVKRDEVAKLVQRMRRGLTSAQVRQRARMNPSDDRSAPFRQVPPDNRGDALGRILALNAAADAAVVDFRRRALRGRLLASVDEIPGWVQRRAKASGKPTHWVRAPADDRGRVRADIRKLEVGMSLERDILAYPGPEWVERVLVKAGSTLDALRELSKSLAAR